MRIQANGNQFTARLPANSSMTAAKANNARVAKPEAVDGARDGRPAARHRRFQTAVGGVAGNGQSSTRAQRACRSCAAADASSLAPGPSRRAVPRALDYCEHTNLRIVLFVALAGMLVPVRAAM